VASPSRGIFFISFFTGITAGSGRDVPPITVDRSPTDDADFEPVVMPILNRR
jgi:hypothetical protein